MSLEGTVKTLKEIPASVLRWVVFPWLILLTLVLGWVALRVQAHDQREAVVEEQRKAEIKAIDGLSARVEGMWHDQQVSAQKQEDLMREIIRGKLK